MKDAKTENDLKRRGYAFRYIAKIKLSDIDMVEADANEARVDMQVNQERALGYGVLMTDGVEFPAIVLRDRGTGMYQLITGRHRIVGFDAAFGPDGEIDAYVIREADPVRVEVLIRSINCIEGEAPSTDQRLQHIAEIRKNNPGMTVKALAADFVLKRDVVTDFLNTCKAKDRADDLNVGTLFRSKTFSQKLQRHIDKLQSDKVFIAAVNVIHQHPLDLRGDAGIELVEHCRVAGSDHKALSILDDRDKSLDAADQEKKDKTTTAPRARASKMMSDVRRLRRKIPTQLKRLYLEGLGCPMLKREMKVLAELIGRLEDVHAEGLRVIEEMERAEGWTDPTEPPPPPPRTPPSISPRPGKPGPEPSSPPP